MNFIQRRVYKNHWKYDIEKFVFTICMFDTLNRGFQPAAREGYFTKYNALWILKLRLILQHLHRFTYVTTHYPTLPPLYLRRSSFYSPSVASATSPGEPPMLLWWCSIYPRWFCNLQWLRPAILYERCKLALKVKRLKTPGLNQLNDLVQIRYLGSSCKYLEPFFFLVFPLALKLRVVHMRKKLKIKFSQKWLQRFWLNFVCL